MTPSSNVVEEAANLLRTRIDELDAEREKLERALASLTDGREGKRGPGRPRGSSAASASKSSSPRRRRRRRGGTRAEQAVTLISENPGIGASEIAKQLGIKPNYMYRVLTDLQKEGLVAKDGRAYSATGAAPTVPTPAPAPEAAPDANSEPAPEPAAF